MQSILNTIIMRALLLTAAAFVIFPLVVSAQEMAESPDASVIEEATIISAPAEEVVNADVLSDQMQQVVVRPYSYVVHSDGTTSEVPIVPTQADEYQLKKRSVVGLKPIEWLAQPVVEDYIEFSGVTVPEAAVTLSVPANPVIVEEVVADNRGRWTIAMGVNSLPAGDHVAYVQAETGAAYSDEVAVAQFHVLSQEEVSNATWMLMIAVGLILIVVLVVVNVQFYLNRQNGMYNRPVVAEDDPDTHIKMDEEVIASVTSVEEQTGRSKK